jgi:hypothetical protein
MTREPDKILADHHHLEDIEKAVAELPADQPAKFRTWFEEFEAERFDQTIQRDAKSVWPNGRVDEFRIE